MSTEEDQKGYVSHFVGNWILKATMAVEEGSADHIRKDLVSRLRVKAQG